MTDRSVQCERLTARRIVKAQRGQSFALQWGMYRSMIPTSPAHIPGMSSILPPSLSSTTLLRQACLRQVRLWMPPRNTGMSRLGDINSRLAYTYILLQGDVASFQQLLGYCSIWYVNRHNLQKFCGGLTLPG